ncbi:flagellar biosynthesis protein FlhA [Agarivorans sp. DSG3-1]|uniref:flagellar biosynthesis protein FlhA n=1 Tax=Agarivorans sp. DSG3-1 TaxID=3342249 RepID=UPI00398F4EDD
MKKGLFGKKSDFLFVVGTVGILAVLFIPLPPVALDFFLICNLSTALLVLLLTFYAEKPLSFSTFPSILLITTLFRLALNISATRLILDDAGAGKVIDAVGHYVVGGNYVVGVVVFIILIVVQYVVVTNGAQRVAEVAARFTLDSMPGKQMSIDADLNIGVIDESEAKIKREEIQQEANFYGAMDGATKFVKGDAIAGIIIIFIDIIAGLMMGVGHHGMSWSQALQTYTLLTVGDGIVTQIPSLIIATATGILITRAATDSKLGSEVISQITSHPIILVILIFVLTFLMFLPGLPKLALAAVIVGVICLLVYAYKAADSASDSIPNPDSSKKETVGGKEDLYQNIELHPIELRLGSGLQNALEEIRESIFERVQNMRKQYALESGFVIPSIKVLIDDTEIDQSSYGIFIYGAKLGSSHVKLNHQLAIAGAQTKVELDGEKTVEPTYGLPAIWVSEAGQKTAQAANYTLVDWQTMVVTHLSELIRSNSHELLTRSEVDNIIARNKSQCETLLEEIVPAVLTITEIQNVLRMLLKEGVSIRNIQLILEVLADTGKRTQSPEKLVEDVRSRLGAFICQPLVGSSGVLDVLTLDPVLERTLISSLNPPERMASFSIDPTSTEKLLNSISRGAQKMMSHNQMPVLICSPIIRRRLKQLTERILPKLAVIAMSEIPNSMNVNSFDVVSAAIQPIKLEN